MGPLANLRVVELAGIGPGPMCAMLLADLGARVLRIDRREPSGLGVQRPARYDILLRNRPSIRADLKDADDRERVLALIEDADILIEGYRPGVAERLGVGPADCLARNPALVYGRMTGWGQTGPMAQAAGHDINYIALTGALHAIGRRGQPPSVPLNLIGDIGGGALYLAFGILAALNEARFSGKGQVVDAAIVDGVASMMAQTQGTFEAGMMSSERGSNITDSGAPFYDVYPCADAEYLSVGAIEPKFFAALVGVLGLETKELPDQWDRQKWPELRERIGTAIASRTRDEWSRAFAGVDGCVAPVLSLTEAVKHPHMTARDTFIEVDGVRQPAPAPRFSRSVPDRPLPASAWDDTNEEEIVAQWKS
jgi:alpha-methylacyl-CoA racemase